MNPHTKDSITRAKLQAKALSYHYYTRWLGGESDAYLTRSARVGTCASVWFGRQCTACGRLDGMTTYGCHDRLCPICAARKARATAGQALQAYPLMMQPEYRVSLLTLTVKNCPGGLLSGTIDSMLEAWTRIRHLRAVKRYVLGWARTLEITVSDAGYHPHIHILIITPATAAIARRADFWRDAWMDAARLDYSPIIDIRDADGKKAVMEVSKYVTKVSGLLEDVDAHHTEIATIADAIFGRRLRTYGGIWAKARRAACMVDVDEMDDEQLTQTGEIIDRPCACGAAMRDIVMAWAGAQYKIAGVRKDGIIW